MVIIINTSNMIIRMIYKNTKNKTKTTKTHGKKNKKKQTKINIIMGLGKKTTRGGDLARERRACWQQQGQTAGASAAAIP